MIEGRVIRSNTRNETLGIIAAAVITLAAIGGGTWGMVTGHDLAGFASVITAIGGLVGVYLYGKWTTKAQLREKRKEVEPPSTSPGDRASP